MTTAAVPGTVSIAEFDAVFESVKNWGRWGEDDQLGTLNYITPDTVRGAVRLVRTGRRVSMQLPINTVAGPDNPNPAIRYVVQGHDIDLGSHGVRFGTDFFGLACHGDSTTHVDALCHVSYRGLTYNGRPAEAVLTSAGATSQDIGSYDQGIVSRGVLLDIPRFREVSWVEPGVAITRAELEACEESEGVEVREGDVLVVRTGHHRRRLELGPWDNGPAPSGEGKAGLHIDTIPWMHQRRISAFLPDGDGETVPSSVDGVPDAIHALQIVAMGMCAADSLDLEGVAAACREEERWDFLVVGLPLRLPGGTGSPWNPIAVF